MTRSTLLLLCLVLTVDGRSLTFKALHSAPGFSWASDQSPGFDYYFEQGGLAARDLDKIKSVMEQSRAHIDTLLDKKATLKIAVFVVDSGRRMRDLTGTEANGLAGASTLAAVYNDQVKAIGPHEICHILARDAWGRPHDSWINEGLAVYSDDQWWGLPLHSVSRGLLDRGQLIPLSEFVHGRWNRKYPDVITYPELGSFVKFVYETRGRAALEEIWHHGAPGNLVDLEQQWRSELRKVQPMSVQYR